MCCEDCAYAANVETAAFARSSPAKAEMLPLEKVATPDCKTIADLCAFLGISPEQTLKAVFYTADPGQPSEQTLMVMVRGDLDVSEAKLLRAISSATLQAASENEIRQRLGAEPGYASPVGLRTRGQGSVLVMADTSLERMANVVTGANEPGYHVVNANLGRDFDVSRMEDIAEAYEGAACARCGGTLHAERAVELGHCFKQGTRYSEPVGVTYLDANGESQPVVMGSYWIGLERLMAAVIESNHDALGIIWPREVAPYHVHLVAIAKDEATAQAAESLYADLCAAGIETLYDDRNLSPGVMFADADLIGVPLRITVSPRSLESGGVEAKWRATDERTIVPLGGVVQTITAMVAQREL